MSQAPQTLSPSAIAARELRYRRHNTHTEGVTEPSQTKALQVLMLASVLLILPATFVVPGQLVLPTVSLLALALAGIVCAAAWSTNPDKSNANLNLWDVGGLLAFIGFGAGMLSQPESIPQLLELNPRRP